MPKTNPEGEEIVLPKRRWFSIREAAEFLDVGEQTVYRWMREGMITFRKVGDSTRFWQEDLDSVMRVFPTPEDASKVQEFCPVCHHHELVAGRVQSSGQNHFYPEKTKFWTIQGSHVPTHARMCIRCGAVTWFGDTTKLKALRKQGLSGDQGQMGEQDGGAQSPKPA